MKHKQNIVIILCAGNGKRMKSKIPKVLHKIKNKSMLIYLIEKSQQLNPEKIILVVNNNNRQLIIDEIFNNGYMTHHIYFVLQKEPKGTGDAVKSCSRVLLNYLNSYVLILNGDVPLLSIETMKRLIENNTNNILVCNIKDPKGYGRILCDEKENFLNIMEDKDCNENEKKINLINTGIYCFECKMILKYIDVIDNNNNQNEYYLTDLPKLILKEKKINLIYTNDENEIYGINTKEQLDYLNSLE